MGTNHTPLLANLFLYSYENEFLDNMIRSGHRRLARSFNLCRSYIDDLIVFNNKKSLDYPLLADLFLYLYENEFLDNVIKSGHIFTLMT